MSLINNNINNSKRILSSKNISIFCEQISMLLRSGVLLHDGIEMMANDTSDIKIKANLQHITNELSNNSSFENALSKANCFPEYMINITSIGTESGTLDKAMSSLATYYDRQATIKETIKSAILYPSILIVMMVSVLLFLSTKVLPVFEKVLQSLGTNLYPIANAIMISGQIFSKFSILFIIIAIILVIISIYFTKSYKGQLKFSNWVWQTKVFEILSLSILASSMSTSISSGLDIDRALELSAKSINNNKVKHKIQYCLNLLQTEHLPFIKAIEKSELFMGITSNILNTGMHTGSLDEAMKYVADLFENNFETMLVRRISLIEPISVAILSTLIGIILISVMFPLLGAMSIIGA